MGIAGGVRVLRLAPATRSRIREARDRDGSISGIARDLITSRVQD
jgi:hypothetical protein